MNIKRVLKLSPNSGKIRDHVRTREKNLARSRGAMSLRSSLEPTKEREGAKWHSNPETLQQHYFKRPMTATCCPRCCDDARCCAKTAASFSFAHVLMFLGDGLLHLLARDAGCERSCAGPTKEVPIRSSQAHSPRASSAPLMVTEVTGRLDSSRSEQSRTGKEKAKKTTEMRQKLYRFVARPLHVTASYGQRLGVHPIFPAVHY